MKMMLKKPRNIIRYKNLIVVPSYHNRINFASEVRKIFLGIEPDAIAVEFPEMVKDNVFKGIKRLPKISLVVYRDELVENYLFIPIDPGDSIIEGIRLFLEHEHKHNLSCYFIDLNVRAYIPEFRDLPDDHAMRDLGLKKFYDTLRDIRPEYLNLDQESFGGFPNFFIDLNIIDSIGETSEKNKESSGTGIPPDLGLKSINRNKRLNERLNKRTTSLDMAREYYMACNLKSLMENHKKIMVIVGLAHWERIKTFLDEDNLNLDVLNYTPFIKSILYNVAPKDIGLAFNEVPYFTYQWEKQWEKTPLAKIRPFLNDFNKIEFIPAIFLKAIAEYEERYEDRISVHKSLQLSQYLRNLVHYDGRLTPDVYHLIIAAKNIVDDDFAWFVYKTSLYYPYAVEKDDEVPTIQILGNKFKMEDRMVTLRRRIPVRRKDRKFRIKRVQQEKMGENWKDEWEEDKYDICSWPEEDIVLESYYNHVRRIGHRLLTEKLKKIHKFNGSLMDGIDIRETIRNWANGEQGIYVREIKHIIGAITTVVMIFDDERLTPYHQPNSENWNEKYRHNISFFAEHDKESDLTFFSTEPGQNLIGPGISIIKLGGLLSEFPPPSFNGGFFDAFRRDFNIIFTKCHLKSERILLSAIYQGAGRYILYIDDKRPKKFLYNIARAEQKEIIFISRSSLSLSTMNRLKYMHILAGKFRRKSAGKYINLKKKFKF
ncbi:MAG: hypothetical protein ACTSWY_15240 [Promethearchaeota archaeon]